MKPKRQKWKVIPSCYRRNLSRSLSNSSVSQLLQLGCYKKRINDLSRNNRILATALQECRVEAAVQSNILKDCARDRNQILFARLKLNEMAKNLAKFVSDLEEVRNYLNVDLLADFNHFTQKRGSPSERLVKQPTVSCVEELTEVSSENDIASMDTDEAPDPSRCSDAKKFNDPPRESGNDVGSANEDIEIAPILFAEDSEEQMKRKKSSKKKTSKISNDTDKGSLTPELNIDLTCVKLKRTSSRRMSQIFFPNSRSTSRGKTSPDDKKENSSDSVTPVLPSFISNQQKASEVEKTYQENFQVSAVVSNKETENSPIFSNNDPILHSNKCEISNTNSMQNFNAVVSSVRPTIESNNTLHLIEDMELTEVIPPVHQIILQNEFPVADKSLDNLKTTCDITKDMKENNPLDGISKEIKENEADKDDASERDSLDSLNIPKVQRLSFSDDDDDDIELPKINEQDEVQNVGKITFCEPNDDVENNIVRSTKSSLIRSSRQKKPVKYFDFFSDSSSDDSFSPFLQTIKKGKRKTVICTKINKAEEKTSKASEKTASHHKISSESKNEIIKNEALKCNRKASNSKVTEKKSSRKSKDMKTSNRDDLPKHSSSQKHTVTKDDKNTKCKTESGMPLLSPEISPGGILKKIQAFSPTSEHQIPLKQVKCSDNIEKDIHNILDTPTSESKRVSFAATDLVCKFKRMSVSKKIADNKKVRRTSKSVLDPEELLEGEHSHLDTVNSSESTNTKTTDYTGLISFSGDTELYTFNNPSNSYFSTVPTCDDLLSSKTVSLKTTFSKTTSTASQKNTNKSDKHSKKVVSALKSTKDTGRLSLKRKKSPKTEALRHICMETKTNILLLESPVSTCKPAKRKSLFKEVFEDNSKENNFDNQMLEKLENKINANKNSELSTQNGHGKTAANTKRQSKAQGKSSLKKPSDKMKSSELSSEMKKKKKSMPIRSVENSPVLKDTVNLPDVQDSIIPKRRSKPVSYKEPNLNKKMRRE